MNAVLQQARRLLARIELRNPERLWVHYSVAISIIFCLFLGNHLLDRVEAANSRRASDVIEASTLQLLHAQTVVEAATALVVGDTADMRQLNKAILQLRDLHHTLANTSDLGAPVEQRLFEGDAPLFYRIREFLSLATLVTEVTGSQQAEALTRLQDLFVNGGLQQELTELTSFFSNQMVATSKRAFDLRVALFVVSICVLLAEIFLIFLPADRLVRSTFRRLRRQTSVLRNSGAQLKDMNERLAYLVGHDPLTDLPNRKSLSEFMTNAIADKSISESALLLVGLDDFKALNESLGAD